jgi:hypothetical protein
VAAGAAVIAGLCVFSQMAMALAPLWHGGDQAAALTNGARQAVQDAPLLLYAWALGRARKVFRRMREGEVFTADNSRAFAFIGRAILYGAVWTMAVAGFTMDQTGPLAEQLRDIGDAARDLALAALGMALIVIGHVMTEATRLKAEGDSIL